MRSDPQNRALATRIHNEIGGILIAACADTPIPPAFLAGLVSVENAQLNPSAIRFESHVFAQLKHLRDEGYFISRGKRRTNYSGVLQSDLSDCSDDALRNLATSWGLTQVMGWHCVRNLKCTVADLRDPGRHLNYAVRLLQTAPSLAYVKRGNWPAVYRIWNTGSPQGKTHDPDYASNALGVMRAYEAL